MDPCRTPLDSCSGSDNDPEIEQICDRLDKWENKFVID